jgi:putative holliday junction resolvase
MGQVIGVDFGMKRTGLAVTDPAGIIASALDTVPTVEVMAWLERYCRAHTIEGFVVGLPLNLNGTATDVTPNVLAFMEVLKRKFKSQWVVSVDERFSSSMAQQTLLASGKGRMARRDKGQLDRISATILLQGWLEQRQRNG